jgi:hypothetical protein
MSEIKKDQKRESKKQYGKEESLKNRKGRRRD